MTERIEKAVVLPVSDQDRYIIVKALEDYSEWAGEAAADKRVEAERASPSDNGEGLDAEADYLEMEQEAAGRLAREWEAANPADGPVAVLPGGDVVGMETTDNSWCDHGFGPNRECVECDVQHYRLVADEEDGDG